MKYVVDASVGFKCVVPELLSDEAIRLRDRYRQGRDDLLAPDFYAIEIAPAEDLSQLLGSMHTVLATSRAPAS